jgi:5-methyltetrahydrofolate--homocysteine methyltransferase
MDIETQPVDDIILPPFHGAQVWDPPMEEVNPYIERMSLLVGRWGYKKGNLSEGEYRQILEGEAQGHYQRLVRENMERRLFIPKAAVAWMRCEPRGDLLRVFPPGDGAPVDLSFPRQKIGQKLSIPDFYKRDGDALGCFTVTVGSPEAAAEMDRLKEEGEYQEYFFWTGFASEYADAVAEWAHRKMLEPLGGKTGARFGPGYPSCPDMSLSRWICLWSEAARIGVHVTESDMLEPEMSTSAILAHRPRARIFNRLE